ncbi:MAG TPA: hypothetical protein VL068_06145 [Microthrixaceae bacterium]|nr:hypothetical protein [Microthrixaceae bacterium]
MTEEEKRTSVDNDDQPADDLIVEAVNEVRRDLAERRRRGEIPHLPAGELDRQFAGVVEAADGGVVEMTPIGSHGLAESAVLETWRPSKEGGLAKKFIGIVLGPLLRVFGMLVRRQVGEFSRRTAEVVNELVDRQNRMQRFLVRAHLDRVRSLEFRVSELEREIDQLHANGDRGN